MSLQYILTQPDTIKGFDKNHPITIYPIKIRDYEKFANYSSILYISKDNFQEKSFPLLFLLFASCESLKMTKEQLMHNLTSLFELITKQKVNFMVTEDIFGFLLADGNMISYNNYDIVRQIIMKQNILFAPKVYKSKVIQKWSDKAIEARRRNHPKIGIEDMLTTVSVLTGKHYWDLESYTIYQLYSDFYRIRKIKSYDTGIMARCQGSDIDIEDFAEDLDLYKNPYDDLFVSKNKIKKYTN